MAEIAQLLSAASTSVGAIRLRYLAEARSRLKADEERLRELTLLLEGLEGKAAEQMPLVGAK